jgi:type IV secretion system protein VirB7
MKILLPIAALLAASACTSAGPFVTNISSDGNYGLNIEKCTVTLNAITRAVSTGQCMTQNIKLRQ